MTDLIKRRILIFGSNGMLGQRLTEKLMLDSNVELFCSSFEKDPFNKDTDYKQVDLSDKKAIKSLINQFYPDVIINAAAYTAVDKSEEERELAWAINADAPGKISKYANAIDAKLVHISTDYVFDGNNGPFDEKEMPNPINYYGRSKLAGENAIKANLCKHAILRTNVLYGPAKYGRMDFVKWVVNSVRSEKTIKIVNDQINNPTYIDDLVQGILKVIEFEKEGIYNIGGSEFLNRFEFTLRIADFFKLDKSKIEPITTKELNQPAKRPLKSGLITLKAETEFGYKPMPIEDTFLLMKKELSL
ncbi:MAG: dTDP-4-dehydrorhamnose reductase [Ignavibacteria bacterium]|jgi:dTDP-4-dehydrorhamnose reductase